MKRIRSIFFATDKDIYDLVHSARKRIPEHVLLEILRSRRIILSDGENRDTLVEYFSNIPHDYYDRELILEQTERGSRSEKISCTEFPVAISNDEIRIAINSVKNKRTNKHRENYHLVADSSSSFKLNVDYQEMDLTRTRLAQHREREAEINIEFDGKSVKVRGPANSVADEIIADLRKELEILKNEQIQESKISLNGVDDPGKRTKFFIEIIKNMSGFDLDDVTALHTDKSDKIMDDDALDSDIQSEQDKEILGEVRRAVLNGRGLTFSPEFKRLSDSGFFISKIQWIAKQKTTFGNKVEFEASLGNPNEGTDFRYNIRGVYKAKPDGTFTKTKMPLEENDKKEYLRNLERTAKVALETIQKSC